MVKGTDALSVQMYFHHIAMIIGTVNGFIIGYACPATLNLGMLMEMSTPFINYRSMLAREELKEFWPTVNSALFLVFYTIFRIMLIPCGFYCQYRLANLAWNHLNTFQ